MSFQLQHEKRTWLSNSEIQLELGRLALKLTRADERRRVATRGTSTYPRTMVNWFLEASLGLVQKTRPIQRRYVIQRLATMAETFELHIIGLETWLLDQVASWRRRCDQIPMPTASSGLQAIQGQH